MAKGLVNAVSAINESISEDISKGIYLCSGASSDFINIENKINNHLTENNNYTLRIIGQIGSESWNNQSSINIAVPTNANLTLDFGYASLNPSEASLATSSGFINVYSLSPNSQLRITGLKYYWDNTTKGLHNGVVLAETYVGADAKIIIDHCNIVTSSTLISVKPTTNYDFSFLDIHDNYLCSIKGYAIVNASNGLIVSNIHHNDLYSKNDSTTTIYTSSHNIFKDNSCRGIKARKNQEAVNVGDDNLVI